MNGLRIPPALRRYNQLYIEHAIAIGMADVINGVVVPNVSGAGRQYWTDGIWWATNDGTTIATSAAETSIFADQSIPPNYMQDGRVIELEASGEIGATATPTVRFRIRWGAAGTGVLLADSGPITLAAVTKAIFNITARIQTRANGAAGSLFVLGRAEVGGTVAPTVGSATGAPAIAQMGSAGILAPVPVTCDLASAAVPLSLTAQFSASNAANAITGHNYIGQSPN